LHGKKGRESTSRERTDGNKSPHTVKLSNLKKAPVTGKKEEQGTACGTGDPKLEGKNPCQKKKATPPSRPARSFRFQKGNKRKGVIGRGTSKVGKKKGNFPRLCNPALRKKQRILNDLKKKKKCLWEVSNHQRIIEQEDTHIRVKRRPEQD